MEDIYQIVKRDIFGNINLDIKVKTATVSDVDGIQVLSFCSNKWIRPEQLLIDSLENDWKIISIDEDGNVSVKKPTGLNDLIKGDILKVIQPQFAFGSHKSAFNEILQKQQNKRAYLPLSWLLGDIEEVEFSERKSSIERESTLRFFFLDHCNPTQLNEDQRLNVVAPMIALKDEVIRVIESLKKIKAVLSWNVRTITRFGVEDEKGVYKEILPANSSGIELRITFSIYRILECKC